MILWVMIIIGGLIAIYVSFIALVSIRIGMGNLQQDGSWVPVGAGILSFLFAFYVFFRVARTLFGLMKRPDDADI